MKITYAPAVLAFAVCRVAGDKGLGVDITNSDSVRAGAKKVAYQLLAYYKGNQTGQTPGILPGPPPNGDYYWWEGGAMWGTLVDYWHYTGDTTYNNLTQDSLIFQSNAPQDNYMPPNWTASLGNDDQGFWGMSAMLAAEVNFQNPPSTDPQWLTLAQAVFNTQAARWEVADCNGGLRWQIPFSNNGYDYKNSIANGIFFNIGARLARYTLNATYADWAGKTYNWTRSVLMDADYNIYDGGHVEHNCTDINKAQFSYTAACFIQGVAMMYNYTDGAAFWDNEMKMLLNRTFAVFFPNNIATEVSCELSTGLQCTTDMLSFKGYDHRFIAQAAQVAPKYYDTIMPVLKASAQAAINSCVGNGSCGFRWSDNTFDGVTGAGQQMNALGAMMSLLLDLEAAQVSVPFTNNTGGTSVGNSAAGSGSGIVQESLAPITGGDRAGAGILTALLLAGGASSMWWMTSKMNEENKWFETSSKRGW